MRHNPLLSIALLPLLLTACPREPPEPVPVGPQAPEPKPDDTKLPTPQIAPTSTPEPKVDAHEQVKPPLTELPTAPVTTANVEPPIKPAT